MSVHKCPNCKDFGFVWQVDEDVSPLTIWDCGECGYRAFEDESLESECPDCNYQFRMFLKDEKLEYWWCTKCGRKTITK